MLSVQPACLKPLLLLVCSDICCVCIPPPPPVTMRIVLQFGHVLPRQRDLSFSISSSAPRSSALGSLPSCPIAGKNREFLSRVSMFCVSRCMDVCANTEAEQKLTLNLSDLRWTSLEYSRGGVFSRCRDGNLEKGGTDKEAFHWDDSGFWKKLWIKGNLLVWLTLPTQNQIPSVPHVKNLELS